jgi:hypothetical protein
VNAYTTAGRILALRNLPGVAGAAIVLLVAVLVDSTLALVPGSPTGSLDPGSASEPARSRKTPAT